MLPLGILYRKCFQGENSCSLAKIIDGLFQVSAPVSRDAQLVCLSKPMLSQGVLVRQSGQSEDRQSGTKTGNGLLKVVALRSQDTLSIDIAQRNLYSRILVGGMCQRIDLQGFFASKKSRFHLLSAI